MSSLNKCQFIGRIGRDPEARFFPDGSPVVNFSVAVDESYKAKDGNKVEKTEWISVQATGPTATFVSSYLGKGRLVYVEGKLSTRKFNDKDGNERGTSRRSRRLVCWHWISGQTASNRPHLCRSTQGGRNTWAAGAQGWTTRRSERL